jgi:hypothetical protein
MDVKLVKVYLAPWWTEIFKVDRVELLTDIHLPYSENSDPLKISFTLRAGTALDYVKEHFPHSKLEVIPVEHCPTCHAKNPSAKPILEAK